MADQHLETAIRGAFDGMRDIGPAKLLSRVNVGLDDFDAPAATEAEVIAVMIAGDGNSPARKAAALCLSRWDGAADVAWADGTAPRSVERRTLIYTRLNLSQWARDSLDEHFPSIAQKDIIIENPAPWDPWYTEERRDAHRFYWDAYRGILEKNPNWTPDAISSLDESTTDIVGRLADPAAPTSYQSKGLVVGYVQSGKTANFTGIIAKAMDAGYRLVIVLTGTMELLRGQTQRRLDRELVGEENILGGRDRNDPDAVRNVDYIGTGDDDWKNGKFLRHGVDINASKDIPAIKRLTSADGDYKLLRAGLDTLDFRSTGELSDPAKPMYDPLNLFGTDIRLAVVKKNKAVLEKLLRDLHDVHASLKEIPVLIVDDEADQASVNTTNPNRKKTQEERDRTAINHLISRIIGEMPRSQYIGYTATPFANVFVSPEDSVDIFPRDFIVALEPSPTYMGGKQFHDLDPLPDDELIDASNSNEKAFVRDLSASSDDEERNEIREALDAFVLTGAIKLWRASRNPGLDFRHHTMLAHQSVQQAEHKDLADLIEDVWSTSEYSAPRGLSRLKSLYVEDFERVHASRDDWDTDLPASFDELKPFVGEALDLILAAGSPVVIVNGSKESEYKAADFNVGRYWRVMVGGAKLSRGFTVEGLTISYYRRRATAADTLMQMGRWFGYREGYRDLVRLYIARKIVDGRGKTYDLYDAFTAIVQDEEAFREQLRRFSGKDEDGRPFVRPVDVPPLVFQQLPWLKPTSPTKMYNAVLDFEGDGGQLKDFPRQTEWGDGANNIAHFEAVQGWIDRLSDLTEFEYVETRRGADPSIKTFHGRTAVVDAEEMFDALSRFGWADGYSFEPTLRFMRRSIQSKQLEDWIVLVPDLKNIEYVEVAGRPLQLLTRTRRARGGFAGSSFRQRAAVERMAGNENAPGGIEAARLSRKTRGAMLLTFARDSQAKVTDAELNAPAAIATLFSLAMPYASAPRGRIGFRVRNKEQEDLAIVDAT